MSTIGLAPPAVVDDLLPVETPFNLFTVARELTGRWEAGVAVWGHPEGVPSGYDPCLEGTFREKQDDWDLPLAFFPAFTALSGIRCSAMGMGRFDDFQDRANRVLNATVHDAAERQLSQGDPLAENASGTPVPFLSDANLTVYGGASVEPSEGLAYLENAIGETGRAGVIGAPPGVVSAWSFDGALRVVGDHLETFLGTPVYVATGFIGIEDSSVAAGTGWAYATGPIFYGLGELIELGATAAETLDRENNDVVYRAERDVVVGWDTALQAGVLVDWTP
jgi:hypothetical protein